MGLKGLPKPKNALMIKPFPELQTIIILPSTPLFSPIYLQAVNDFFDPEDNLIYHLLITCLRATNFSNSGSKSARFNMFAPSDLA